MSHSHKIRNALGIVAIAILALLGAGELFARYYLRLTEVPLWQPHPAIEYLAVPEQAGRPLGKQFYYNGQSMRSQTDFAAPKPDQQTRILVFGDSVINGGSHTAQAELATEIAQAALAAKSGPVAIGNVSAGSWGPGNWLNYARTYGFFEADIIVLVISSHDVADNPTYAPLNRLDHPQSRPLSALWYGIVKTAPRLLGKFGISAGNASEVPAVVTTAASEADIERGLSDLSEFLSLAQSATSAVAVIQYPERNEAASGKWQKGHDLIRAAVERSGIPITDSRIYQLSQQPQADSGGYYRDTIHPNAQGQQLLAEDIAAAVSPFFPPTGRLAFPPLQPQ